MKRILLVLALAASLQVANAQNNQVKSIPAATSALEKAAASAENPKQNTKVATWLKYGQALIDAYSAPIGNAWLGMSQQDAAFLTGGEKPSAEEQVTVGGQAYLKQVFATKNYYFNQNGQLAIIEITEPIFEDCLGSAFEALQKAVELDVNQSKAKDYTAMQTDISQKMVQEAYDAYSLQDLAKASEKFENAYKALGAKPETFAGLAGMGDLIVTCLSQHSRNRYVGEHIGKGETLDQVLAGMKMIAEGVPTCRSTKALAEKLGVEMPIVNAVYDALFNNKPVKEVLKELMSRELKAENW